MPEEPALLNLLADTGWAQTAHWLLAEARWYAEHPLVNRSDGWTRALETFPWEVADA